MTNITRVTAKLCLLGGLCGWAAGAAAQDLVLPAGASSSYSTVNETGAYAVPIGPWKTEGGIPTQRIEGRVQLDAWRIQGTDQSPLELTRPLRDRLRADGFEIQLDCATSACGGFDFRFETLVLPAPEMFVNLIDYQFVSAISSDGGAVTLLASRDNSFSYLQIIRAGNVVVSEPQVAAAPAPQPAKAGSLTEQLELSGHAILADLVFQSGSSDLGAGTFQSLNEIAAYLEPRPGLRILLVGHTDATGSLDANQAVSLRRAESARQKLLDLGVNANQIAAHGAGYLAPVASNLSQEGRTANRRIEAVVLPLK
ncbi:MAG: OmpA family protein [Pelagimonas sp.]|jgi:OOP family OmpA-OmpF porin|nr:OmpA family protein [Pelagimonas sp.]